MNSDRTSTISETLRIQLDDLLDIYQDAKNNDDGPRMEKLSKTIADQAKKIREQETHERESIKRNELRKIAKGFSEIIGVRINEHCSITAVKKWIADHPKAADDDLAADILELITNDFDEAVEVTNE